MRLISIPQSAIEKHLCAYYEAIKYALDELSAGKAITIGRRDYSARTEELKSYFGTLKDNFSDRNKNILVAPPVYLRTFLQKERPQWDRVCVAGKRESCVATLNALFSYEHFSGSKGLQIHNKKICGTSSVNWGAMSYIESLGVKYCPYCNAETVYAIRLNDDNKTIRSALDHYYAQKDYPCLALSLYNLVPTCTRCNTSLKRDEEFVPPEDYANPYEDDIHKHTRFSYLLTGTTENLFDSERSLELILRETDVKSQRVDKLMEFFRINDVYNALFKFEALNTLETKRRLMSGYERQLRCSMPELTDEQFYRLVYGCSLNPDKINQERLSKMIIDLVESTP